MKKKQLVSGKIRQLSNNQKPPYELLLLADESVDMINCYLPDCEVYVFEQEMETLAVCAVQEIESDTVEIKNLAVAEAYQGQGIGPRLIKDAVDRAKANGYRRIIIGTADAGIKQLYIYQKAGFEIYDIKKDFIRNNYPEPIYENGIQLKHMIMLKMELCEGTF